MKFFGELIIVLTDHFNSITPFPNPVQEVLDVPLVLPAAAPVRITVEDAQGKQMRELSFSETRQGLNTFPVDMTGKAQGMYLLQIYYLDKVQTYRIMVQP